MSDFLLLLDFDGTSARGNTARRYYLNQFGFDELERVDPHLNRFSGQGMAYGHALAGAFTEVNREFLGSGRKPSELPYTRQQEILSAATVDYAPGVLEFIDHHRVQAQEAGKNLHVYVISSNKQTFLENTQIGKKTQGIFGCTYDYSSEGVVTSVHFTDAAHKVRVLDELRVKHSLTGGEPLPYKNIAYFGDGETDIPILQKIKKGGGTAVGIWNPNHKDQPHLEAMLAADCLTIALPDDFRPGQAISNLIAGEISQSRGSGNAQGRSVSVLPAGVMVSSSGITVPAQQKVVK